MKVKLANMIFLFLLFLSIPVFANSDIEVNGAYISGSNFHADDIDLKAFREEFDDSTAWVFAYSGKDKLKVSEKAKYTSQQVAKAFNLLLDKAYIFDYLARHHGMDLDSDFLDYYNYTNRKYGDHILTPHTFADRTEMLPGINKDYLLLLFPKTLNKVFIKYVHLEDVKFSSTDVLGFPINASVENVLNWAKYMNLKIANPSYEEMVSYYKLRKKQAKEQAVIKISTVSVVNNSSFEHVDIAFENIPSALLERFKNPIFNYDGKRYFWKRLYGEGFQSASGLCKIEEIEDSICCIDIGDDLSVLTVFFYWNEKNELRSFAGIYEQNEKTDPDLFLYSLLKKKYGDPSNFIGGGFISFWGNRGAFRLRVAPVLDDRLDNHLGVEFRRLGRMGNYKEEKKYEDCHFFFSNLIIIEDIEDLPYRIPVKIYYFDPKLIKKASANVERIVSAWEKKK